MNRKVVLVVLVLAAACGALWWWRHSKLRVMPATSTVTQPGGSARPQVTGVTAAPPRAARLAVTVTNAQGPLADAAVRIAPREGDAEIAIARTGKDGIARLAVAPGAYDISASAAAHAPAAVERTVTADEEVQLALVLTSGGRVLSGTITDASGGAVAGARIDAARVTTARPESAVAVAVSGADGTYSLTIGEGQLLVAASHADYSAQLRYVELGPTGATADFSLVPGGVIEGIVRDETSRQPVAGARVLAARDGGVIMLAESGRRGITTGPDGTFRIGGLRPGAYELVARADTLTSRSPTRVGLGVAEQLGDVEILVGLMPVVRGKVVGETGAPIADIAITAFGRNGSADARSSADGTFTLVGLAPGRWTLMGRGTAHLPAGTTPFELADQDVTGLVVTVRTAATLVGHVEPRQPCEVRFELDGGALRDGSMPMLVRPTQARADGAFELVAVSPGKATVGARCPNGDQGSLAVTVAPGMPEIIVQVTPGAAIAGRVVDGDGTPVASASVMATTQTGSEHMVVVNGMVTSGVQGLTSASGAFELRGLTAGTYQLAVLAHGKPMKLRTKPEAATVKLGATEHKTGVELAVDRPNGTITGTVTSADGTPIADAWVSVHRELRDMMDEMLGRDEDRPGPRGPDDGPGESRMMTIESNDDGDGGPGGASAAPPALTDAKGHFAITGLPHGTYQVIAEAQAGKLRGRAVATPNATIAITAVGLTTLSGKVRAATPITVFAVELDGPTRTERSFANPDGRFELGRVDPGDYTVRVRSTAGNGEARVTVVANQPATVELTLVANAILTGTIVDATGKPVPSVGVAVVQDTGDGRVQISIDGPPPTSGPDGTFRIEAPAGKSILILMTPPRPTTRPGLLLEAGKTLELGTITIGAGAPP